MYNTSDARLFLATGVCTVHEYFRSAKEMKSRWAAHLVILTAILLGLGSVMHPSAAGYAQGDSRLFPETGKIVRGKFLAYWNEHGGLPQQGFPISEEMQEKSDTDGKLYTVQYFERAIFELHPEFKAPNDVLLSLLGVFRYKEKYPSGRASGVVKETQPGNCIATHDDSDVDSGRGFIPEAPERQVVGEGLVLTGRVLSSRDCAPIAGAKLEMRPEINNDHPEAQRATLYTDASGRYRFQSNFPEHIHMRVSVHGFTAVITNAYHTTPGKSVDSYDIVLVPDSSCRWFAQTGQALCGTFLAYWDTHGSLPQQGFPISDKFVERSALDGKTYRVQYFERAIFELHPENAGSQYEVLLSQLGKFRYQSKYPSGVGPQPTRIPPPSRPGWSQIVATNAGPKARADHTAIIDPVRKNLIIFGGRGSATFGDT